MLTTKKKAAARTAAPITEPESDVAVEDLDEALEVIPYTYSITAYGADYPVDSIIKRMEAEDIIVPRFSWEPGADSEVVGFQREYVWPRPKADRFIESLLLGLPVPGIFLVKEAKAKVETGERRITEGRSQPTRLCSRGMFFAGCRH